MGNSDLETIISKLLTEHTVRMHAERIEPRVVAIVTLEHDMRFFSDTMSAVLEQTVLPHKIVIADCTGLTTQSVAAHIDVQLHKPSRALANATVNTDALLEPEQYAPGRFISDRYRVDTGTAASRNQPHASVEIEIVNTSSARSFGDACEKVISSGALTPEARAVWMLHDDSRPADEHCLEALLDAWANTPKASLFGAKQLDWQAKRLHTVGYYAAHHDVTSLVIDGEPDQEQYDSRCDVYAVSLAGALLPLNAHQSRERIQAWFTTYRESEDYGRRICLSGGRVVVVPSARIAHRRARFDGIRTNSGRPVDESEPLNTYMREQLARQQYMFTDMRTLMWPLMWIARLFWAFGVALRSLVRKQPYDAWCTLLLPWRGLTQIFTAANARRAVSRATHVSRAQLSALIADRHQLDLWHARLRAFAEQNDKHALNTLELEHLRRRRLHRWMWAIAAAVLAFAVIVAMYWQIFRSAFSGGSLYSDSLLATGASFSQLVKSATTPWVFGSGTGAPAPPTPWLLVLMVCSLITGGHVPAAMSLMFFAAAPAMVLSFWALAGIFTRSDTVRVLSSLAWFGLALAFGLFASANLAMLTVMVCLPAAFAYTFRAVGVYRTEQLVNPRASAQSAAIAALLFMPVVAAEPQLLFALIVVFVIFLLLMKRHRLLTCLIPIPAAFTIAPTILNSIRYASSGMWRQLFGDIMVPVASVNGEPRAVNLTDLAMRALGMDQTPQWMVWNNLDSVRNIVICIMLLLLVIASLVSLLMPTIYRSTRIMWSVMLCGVILAGVSAMVVIGVTTYGDAAGSVLPGFALACMGLLSCTCLAAGSAVKPFYSLRLTNGQTRRRRAVHAEQVVVAIVLALATVAFAGYGMLNAEDDGLGYSDAGLPVVAQDYLNENPNRRVLALAAVSSSTIDYAVMRTSRGDIIDSSPAERVRTAFALQTSEVDNELASVGARLLANPDDDAIDQLEELGFGGIYVVTKDTADVSDQAGEQLISNITASNGAQAVVTNDDGCYFRLTSDEGMSTQSIDTTWQTRTEHSAWRTAWLWCLGIITALYCLVAIGRTKQTDTEDEQ